MISMKNKFKQFGLYSAISIHFLFLMTFALKFLSLKEIIAVLIGSLLFSVLMLIFYKE